MKIHKVTLTNFRGYKNPTTIDFNDLTVFVGRNDIGKSTVLEALDLFFNDGKGVIKYDDGDVNISSELKEYAIGVSFAELPENIIVDASFHTNLADEYLLNEEGNFEIIKKFNGKKCSDTFVRANHPTNELCANLHNLKRNELKALIQANSISCDNYNANSVMRRAIWNYYIDDLKLSTVDINITDGDDTKKIWATLSRALPVYSLFQSDRKNSDKDNEVQDPLTLAVKQFFQEREIQDTLTEVQLKVEEKLMEVANRTLAKMRDMDPNIADHLKTVIPQGINTKWAKVFDGVSLSADDNIPINKRGSGVKRLILLNFFRAEAERRQETEDCTGVIYAIEEPETSQHFANQKLLADALIELSNAPNTQVILTTHSGVVVKQLKPSDLRLIDDNDEGEKEVNLIQSGLLGYPSLNEVNYIAFDEATEEYHDELFGFIESHDGWMTDYESGKPQRPYIRQYKDGHTEPKQHTLTLYIRDVQHHPENTNNARYTDAELKQSIEEMRSYIKAKLANP